MLVCLVPGKLVLKQRTRQLTVKFGKLDGLVCICALCLEVQLETLLVAGVELLEGTLETFIGAAPAPSAYT